MKKGLLSFTLTAVMVLSLFTACSFKDSRETASKINSDQSNTSVSPKKDSEKELIEVTLNEVAHSIFYAPMYVAIENGYFESEGIKLDLICGFGADKVMTAVLSGEADIGFMGSESSIYTYNEGASDHIVNFAQLTQRAGNFLVSREPIENFQWESLKGSTVLGGRKGVVHQSM